MDRIALRGIAARGRHGANPGERDVEQTLSVDVEFNLDLRVAERSDRLEETVDYAQIHASITRIVASNSYCLLERLAGHILDDMFADRRIVCAQLTIGKPNLLDGATPSVTLVRDNPNYRAFL